MPGRGVQGRVSSSYNFHQYVLKEHLVSQKNLLHEVMCWSWLSVVRYGIWKTCGFSDHNERYFYYLMRQHGDEDSHWGLMSELGFLLAWLEVVRGV